MRNQAVFIAFKHGTWKISLKNITFPPQQAKSQCRIMYIMITKVFCLILQGVACMIIFAIL